MSMIIYNIVKGKQDFVLRTVDKDANLFLTLQCYKRDANDASLLGWLHICCRTTKLRHWGSTILDCFSLKITNVAQKQNKKHHTHKNIDHAGKTKVSLYSTFILNWNWILNFLLIFSSTIFRLILGVSLYWPKISILFLLCEMDKSTYFCIWIALFINLCAVIMYPCKSNLTQYTIYATKRTSLSFVPFYIQFTWNKSNVLLLLGLLPKGFLPY